MLIAKWCFLKVWKMSGAQHYLPPVNNKVMTRVARYNRCEKRWESDLSFPIPGSTEYGNTIVLTSEEYTNMKFWKNPVIHDWFHKFASGIMKQFYLFLTFWFRNFISGSGTWIFGINELNFCWKRCVPLDLCPDRGFYGISATGLKRPDCI